MKPAKVILTLIVLVVLGGAAVFGVLYSMSRGPLRGETKHDFGLVLIDDGRTVAEHQFVLTNATSEPLTVKSVKPSCGCTTTELESNVIPAGEALRLDAKLVLEKSSYKESKIVLAFDNDEIQTLFLEAVGRARNPLSIVSEAVRINDDGVGVATVFLEMFDTDDPPPPPRLSVPGATADEYEFNADMWSQSLRRKSAESRPAVWRTQVRVTHRPTASSQSEAEANDDDAVPNLPPDTTLQITVTDQDGKDAPVEVSIIRDDGTAPTNRPGRRINIGSQSTESGATP